MILKYAARKLNLDFSTAKRIVKLNRIKKKSNSNFLPKKTDQNNSPNITQSVDSNISNIAGSVSSENGLNKGSKPNTADSEEMGCRDICNSYNNENSDEFKFKFKADCSNININNNRNVQEFSLDDYNQNVEVKNMNIHLNKNILYITDASNSADVNCINGMNIDCKMQNSGEINNLDNINNFNNSNNHNMPNNIPNNIFNHQNYSYLNSINNTKNKDLLGFLSKVKSVNDDLNIMNKGIKFNQKIIDSLYEKIVLMVSNISVTNNLRTILYL